MDGAIDTVRAVCQGNPDAAVLVLQPVVHANVTLKAILEKRAHIESRLVQSTGLQIRGYVFSSVVEMFSQIFFFTGVPGVLTQVI